MMKLRNVLVLVGLFLLTCEAAHDNNGLRASGNVEEIVQIEEIRDERMVGVIEEQGERRLINFWSLLFQICPPGPLGHHCRHPSGGSGGNGSGDSNGGDGNGSAASDGSSASNGGNGGNSASAATESGAADSASSGNGVFGSSMSRSSFILMLVAAAAATAALVAAVVGNRRNREARHSLSGSVDRRMRLFTNLAEGNLCGDRPARVFEMENRRDFQVA